MVATALALLSLAIITGLLVLPLVLTRRPPPRALVYSHGPVAVLGVILVNLYRYLHTPAPWEAGLLLAMASVFGFMMFLRDNAALAIPRWLLVVHIVLALAGFIFLILFACIQEHVF